MSAKPSASTNPDGLPMQGDQNIPLGAGVDLKDKRKTLHDAAIPELLPTLDGRQFPLRESIDYHERIEFALMQAGMGYDEAHRLATEAEHKRIRDLGFDPSEIETLGKPYIDKALSRAKKPSYCAARTVDNIPYIDSGAADLLERPGEDEDDRVIFDRDGEKYTDPETYSAAGRVPFLIVRCYDDENLYAVLEPNSAEPWFDDVPSRREAERKIDALIRKKGSDWAKQRIDAAPALSQQQLQARHEASESAAERASEGESEGGENATDERYAEDGAGKDE